jgi:tRNA pseudouridine13 synthase
MCSAMPSPKTSLSSLIDFQSLPYAHGGPSVTGIIRSAATDFVVVEDLAFPLTGSGEHLYLRVRKIGQNTRWICKQLANRLELPLRAIGYAGIKDRHAAAEQWFSVHLPGLADPSPEELRIDGVEILEFRRHAGKLRVGALTGNRFRIVIRQLEGNLAALDESLERLRGRTVPNYFGAQRFGRDGRNLTLLTQTSPAQRPSREARSFGLSALRSALFNGFLAERLRDDSWCEMLPGEIGYCADTGKYHHADSHSDSGAPLVPTGLLWGPGQNRSTNDAFEKESAFFADYPDVTAILTEYDVRMMRRPLGMPVHDFSWIREGDVLTLDFRLTRGQFATVVLREIIDFSDASY